MAVIAFSGTALLIIWMISSLVTDANRDAIFFENSREGARTRELLGGK